MDNIYQTKFIEIYKNNIKRQGAEQLLDYLLKSDFFSAPASTRFHSNFEGGLLEHSLNVFERLIKLVMLEYGEGFEKVYSMETLTICALLHDICKVDYYAVEMRNVKVDGEWIQRPFYTVNDKLPYGHGEKSVYIISGFMKLTREEAMAINWHMGGFDARVIGGAGGLSESFEKFPLSLLLHLADMQATYLDEEKR